jgi:hypothetical protein
LSPSAQIKKAWVIALDTADTKSALAITGGGAWKGGTFRAPQSTPWTLVNRGRSPVRAIVVIKP